MSPNTSIFTPWIKEGATYPGETLHDGRAMMALSPEDDLAWQDARDDGTVAAITDQNTGTRWIVRAVDCGADCKCAAEAEPLHDHAFELKPNSDFDCLICNEHVSQHPDRDDYLAKKTMEDIIRVGHQVMYIFPGPDDDGYPFFYTVGRTVKDRPELLLTGALPGKVGQWILNQAAILDDETPLQAGTEIPADTLLQGHPVRIVAADPEAASMFKATDAFGDDVTALQIIWPDVNGAFPGDPDYDLPEDAQPIYEVTA